MNRNLVYCLALVALLTCSPAAPTAHAEPLLITSGGASLYIGDLGAINLQGRDFFLAAATGDQAPAGFARGSTVVLSGTIEGQSEWPDSHAIVNGVTYTNILTVMSLSFMAAPFAANPTELMTVFTTPFTLTGRVRGFSGNSDSLPPVFDVQVAGRGTASVGPMRDVGDTLVNLGVLSLRFEPAAAPVPEPGTLMLLGAGAAAAALRARRRVRDR